MYRELNAGRLVPYRGRHIAVVGKQVVGSDDDPMRLRYAVADALRVPRNRVVVAYIEDEFGN